MKFKMFVASFLAAAMLLTSPSFVNIAFADEIENVSEAPADNTVQEETTPAAEQPAADQPATENENTAGEKPAQSEEQAAENNTGSEGEPAVTETPAEEDKSENGEATETPAEETEEQAASSDETGVATETETSGEDGNKPQEMTELIIGNENTPEKSEFMKSTDYFEVDGGELKRKVVDGKPVPLQEDVKIPANCEVIPADIFKGDRIVKTIRFDKSYEEGGETHNEQLLITIADGAFENSAIEQIIGLPSGVTAIPDNCFIGSNLKSITYETDSTDTTKSIQQKSSKSITQIGSNAFKGVRFSDTVLEFYGCTTIGASAFEESNITEISFIAKDGNLQTIGIDAFKNCSKLEALKSDSSKWPATIESIGSSAFEGTALVYADLSDMELAGNGFNPAIFKNCKKLISVVLHKNATKIPNNLFNGCTALKEVSFPEPNKEAGFNGITEIDYDAFYNCTALNEISLRNTYKIGQTAFGNCTNLKSIYFGYDPAVPEFIAGRSIADSAFYNNLKKTAGYVMHGYDDDFLKEYARKHNYTYETLNKIYTATKSEAAESKYATIKVSPTKILPGEKVTVTVTPTSGYSLTAFKVLKATTQAEITPVTLESFDKTKEVFSFLMPEDADYDLIIKPIVKKTSTISLAGLSFSLKGDAETLNPVDNAFNLGSGKKYQIEMRNGTETLPNWLWSYSSDKPNNVAVTSAGVLSSITSSTNPAFVTVKMLNGTKSVKFKVVVNDVLTIKRVYVKGGENDPETWVGSKGIVIPAGKNQLTVMTRNTTDSEGNPVKYPVVRIPKSLVAVEAYSFEVNIDAYTENDAPTPLGISRIVKSDWTTTDSSIAIPVTATATTNTNTIKIVKGSSGETAIGIKTLNYGEKEVNGNNKEDTAPEDMEYNLTFVIVEVWDDSPRIAEKEIVINAQKNENWVTLFNAYADQGDNASGKVYEDGMFNVYYDRECTKPCKDFTIEYSKDKQRMNFVTTDEYDDKAALNKTKAYKGLWLDVTLHERGKYIIPLPTLKIENKPLAPKMTTLGKLNLFYNTQATLLEQGNVKISQSLTSEELTDVNFVSKDNYKKYGKRALEQIYLPDTDKERNPTIEDKFTDNFNVEYESKNKWKITRKNVPGTPHDIYTDNLGRAILTGYIYLSYSGYKYPSMLAFTVPTEITAPKYHISPASASGHIQVPNRKYEVQLLDTQNNVVPINGNILSEDEGGNVVPNGLALDAQKTTNKSIKTDPDSLTENLDANKITLCVNGTPQSGVAVIRIHMKKWSDYQQTERTSYLRYSFELKVSSLTPKVTANASNIYFNTAFSGEKFKIQYNCSHPDAIVYGFKKLTYTGTAATKGDAEELIVKTGGTQLDFDGEPITVTEDGILTFELPDEGIPNGIYGYKVTPVIAYEYAPGDYSGPIILSPIAFTVTVKKVSPALKLTNPTFTINYLNGIVGEGGDFGETSYCETKYSLANLSSGTTASNYTVNIAGATITPITEEAPNFSDIAAQSVTDPVAGGIYKVARSGGSRAPFSYKYQIRGAKISKDEIEATLSDFNIIVKGVQTAPSVSVTATGGINFVNVLGKTTYDFTVKGVQGTLTPGSVSVVRITPAGSESDLNFEATQDVGNPNRVYVTIKEPNGIRPNTNYDLRFYYKLTAMGDTVYYTRNTSIKPTQAFPTIKAGYGSRKYIYAGEDTDADDSAELNRRLTLYVNVPAEKSIYYHIVSDDYPAWKTNSRGEYIMTDDDPPEHVFVENGVRWAPSTRISYKRAFEITDVKSLGDGVYKFDLILKNAAVVKQNVDLVLDFLVYFKGQAINTDGAPISFKIQVRK